jgi:hypothetical protein
MHKRRLFGSLPGCAARDGDVSRQLVSKLAGLAIGSSGSVITMVEVVVRAEAEQASDPCGRGSLDLPVRVMLDARLFSYPARSEV